MSTPKYKIMVVGPKKGGKTSICSAYVNGRELDPIYNPTRDLVYRNAKIDVFGKPVLLDIWDTAGKKILMNYFEPVYYQETDGFILVFDVTDRESFVSANKWYNEVIANANNYKIAGILVGNKLDSESCRSITWKEGMDYAWKHEMTYIETSVKTMENIDLIFEALAYRIFDNIRNKKKPKPVKKRPDNIIVFLFY